MANIPATESNGSWQFGELLSWESYNTVVTPLGDRPDFSIGVCPCSDPFLEKLLLKRYIPLNILENLFLRGHVKFSTQHVNYQLIEKIDLSFSFMRLFA